MESGVIIPSPRAADRRKAGGLPQFLRYLKNARNADPASIQPKVLGGVDRYD
jgi:hypothetical protein